MSNMLEVIQKYQDKHGYPPNECELTRLTGYSRTTVRIKLKKLDEVKAKQATKRLKLRSKPSKAQKRPSVRILKDKLWNEVKRITRNRFPPYCYTCGVPVEGKNDQSGHGKPMGALPLRYKYDIRNIRRQCMICNIHRGGCQDIFMAKLEQEEEGLQFLNEACYLDVDSNAWRIRQDTPQLGGKDATIFIEKLLEQYKNSYL